MPQTPPAHTPQPLCRPSDAAGIALSFVLAALLVCGMKWAGLPWLEDLPWWLCAIAPVLAVACDFVCLFGLHFIPALLRHWGRAG